MSDFDVAIVGAGPAGSWAAYKLARGGARVALVDGSHPREKPCGGGVTARAFELLAGAIAAERLPAVAARTASFRYRDASASVPLGDGSSLLIAPRRDFDGALRDAAIAQGAIPVGAQVTDVARADGGWTIRSRDSRVTADWLFGADGANSLVRRRVHRAFSRRDLSLATGYYVASGAPSDIHIAFEDNPPGYLWSFPRPDHLAVGICARADVSSSASLLQRAGRWIERHVSARTGEMRRYSWPIPSLDERSLRAERPAGERWMLLGDAAGLVDPITREGIYFALASGDEAADAVLSDGDAGARYASRIRSTLHDELIRAARLESVFFRPRFTCLLLGALQRSRSIRDVMADLVAGRQTYRGLRRRLLATCEVRLMLKLLRI